MFWLEAESFRNTEDPSQWKGRAAAIMDKYFNPNSKYEINVNSSVVKNINERLSKSQIDRTLFIKVRSDKNFVLIFKAQASIFNLLEMDSLPRFLQSAPYLRHRGKNVPLFLEFAYAFIK